MISFIMKIRNTNYQEALNYFLLSIEMKDELRSGQSQWAKTKKKPIGFTTKFGKERDKSRLPSNGSIMGNESSTPKRGAARRGRGT